MIYRTFLRAVTSHKANAANMGPTQFRGIVQSACSQMTVTGCVGGSSLKIKHSDMTSRGFWHNKFTFSLNSVLDPRGLHSATWCVVRGYAKKAKKEKVVTGGKKKVALTSEELDGVLELPRLQEEMQEAVEDFRQQLIQQVSVRTNIGVYDSLQVKTDDGVFPLIQLGQIVQKTPTLILVNMAASPQYIVAVKDAITQSGLNVNPQQEGTTIFIPVPKVTREHREGLAKNAKTLHDKAKTRLRDIHNKYTKKVKAAKEHHQEDIIKGAQDMVLDEMHTCGQQLDSLLHAKQEELLGAK